MTQEQKDLLLKDLCARLIYGVKCVSGVDDATLIIEGINPNCNGASEVQVTYERSGINFDTKISSIKPYLLPLSSMTEEQKKELIDLEWSFDSDNARICNILECFGTYSAYVDHSCCSELIDWFHKNHIDYRGMIPMGLANDATGLNIY